MSVTALNNYVQSLEAPVVAGSHKAYFRECGEGSVWNSGIVTETDEARELAMSNNMNARYTFVRRQADNLEMNIMDPGNDTCPDPRGLEQGAVQWAKFRGSLNFAVENNHTWALHCSKGEDAFGIIMEDINPRWLYNSEAYILNMIRGLIAYDAANHAGTEQSLVYDAVAAAAAAAAAGTGVSSTLDSALNLAHLMNAKNRLSCDRFTGALIHQNVANSMRIDGLLSRDASGGGTPLYTLNGETNVTVVTNPLLKPLLEVNPGSGDGLYYTVVFKDGMFAYGEGCHPDPLEVHKNPCIANGDGGKALFTRRQFVLMPTTHSFIGLDGHGGGFPKKGAPTLAECQNAAIYDRTVPFDFQSGMFIISQV